MHPEALMIAGQTSVFQTARVSEVGGRPNNEDFCGFLQVNSSTCWAVADGLGSHNAGELASKAAVETVLESFRQNPELSAAAIEGHVSAAQEAILNMQRNDPATAGMRTTLVMLISDSRQALWAHIGDSRLYRFQACGLVTQTEDHSVPQSLAKAGEISPGQIRGHADRNRLLRALGDSGPARASVLATPVLLSDTDAFLLCTDGFWEYVLEIEMLADLVASSSPQGWLDRATVRLRQRAWGEYDNYTALAIFYVRAAAVQTASQPSGPAVRRFLRRRRRPRPAAASQATTNTGDQPREAI
jgi:serine/threonine protein phosphatase PrpC